MVKELTTRENNKLDSRSKSTSLRKIAFLENYPKFRMVSKTAEAIGIDRTTVFRWLRDDDVFFNDFNTLKKVVDSDRLELYEAELDKRALFGSKNSDILLMFGLKALDRDRYEGRQVQQNFTGNIIVQSAIPKPDYVVTDTTKLLPKGDKDSAGLPMAINGDKEN